MKNKKVCNKTRSPPASLLFKGKGTEHTTIKWSIARGKLFTGIKGVTGATQLIAGNLDVYTVSHK